MPVPCHLTGNDKVVPPQSGFSDDDSYFFPSRQIFFLAFLDFVDETLFMPNGFLKGFVKKYIDFHQKFAKIEDFKFDHSKKLLNIQNTEFLYRKSYSKFDGF